MKWKNFFLFLLFLGILLRFLKTYQKSIHDVFSRKYLSTEELNRDVRKLDHKLLARIQLKGLMRRGTI